MTQTKPDKRVLIIGWDGATFDLIEPWIAQGHLPNLARLMQEGSYRRLRSTVPTLSPPAWTSFMTGKNPGRHGTFDFFRRNPSNYELLTTHNNLAQLGTLFRWVSHHGKKVGALNVPYTYPPEPVNGFMVSGLGAAPEWEFVYPPELKSSILAMNYQIDNPIIYDGQNDEAYLAAALETTRIRAATALHLLKTQPWELFMVVFMNVDQILTFLWHHMDETHPRHDPQVSERLKQAALTIHVYLDEVLGEFLNEVDDETTVIVASDHGMGPLYKEVYLNSWLEQKGYLVRRPPSASREIYNTIARKVGFSRESIWRKIGRARTQAAKSWLPKRLHGLVPTEQKSLTEVVDWSKTVAYSFGNVGQIYVNVRGREPEGIVHPGAEYEQVIQRLITDLRAFTDPEDGKPVVDKIYRREELYDGLHMDESPDLNVIMRDYGYITVMRREFASGATILEPCASMTGFHRREGIFVVRGRNIQTGSHAPANITQVTPTALYNLGLPIPDDMDGTPMTDLFHPEFVHEHPVQTTPSLLEGADAQTLSPDEEAEIQRRLQNLGYLG